MLRLAVPGWLSTSSEYLAYEFFTVAAALISTDHLAASVILANLLNAVCQIPNSFSSTSSVRIANYVGALAEKNAKVAARAGFFNALMLGTAGFIGIIATRYPLAHWLVDDQHVITLVVNTAPVVAAALFFDTLNTMGGAALRGLGLQSIMGKAAFVAWYCIGIPLGCVAGFSLHWDLYGLDGGVVLALAV